MPKKKPGMVIDQEYEVVPLVGDADILKEHPQNPNRGDDETVEESVDVNGWYGAVIAQRSTGYVLAGNTRFRVARERGAKEIPVIWKDVDDEEAIRIMLVDNESARKAEMDQDTLTLLLEGLGDLRGTGYADGGVDAALDAVEALEEGSDDTDDVGDDVPDDVYTPEYGIMIVCESEEDQADIYSILETSMAGRGGVPQRQLRVVAV